MSAAVLLVSHGTVDDLDDLGSFVTRVRHGHPPSPALVAELRRRYQAIGGQSPLNAVNARVAAKLAARLETRVAWANRLWRPFVRDVLAGLAADGARRVAVVPLAQHSAHVYADDARRGAEETGVTLACAPDWGESPALHEAFARRIRSLVGEIAPSPAGSEPGLAATDATRTTVIFTAHSLPRVVVDRGDPYEREVRASAAAVSERLGPGAHTAVAFQSQGLGTPGDWLGPDLGAALDDAAARGHRRVVFAPIGFLADHVEILYDLDIEAAAMARERGLAWARTPSLNDDDDLIDVLADVARPLLAQLGHA